MNLLELREVTKEYSTRRKVQAVRQVSLTLNKGESLGLVGESGSGKSTLAKLIMKLESLTSGEILLSGQSIHGRKMNELWIYKRIQLVLQDSSSSLHPKMRVREILQEPILNFFPERKVERDKWMLKWLSLVGLDESFLSRYPHQLSGGQKQRVCIAKALAVEPEIIIFDESVASLDEASQVSILAMLKHIQQNEQLSYLFITHDLPSMQELCDRKMVMYQGEIVEVFSHWDVQRLKHPYSRLLFQTQHMTLGNKIFSINDLSSLGG